MKSIIAILPFLAATPMVSGFVVEMFTGAHCGGQSLGQRNVYDNSCAYVNPGFSSFRLIANGWEAQQGTIYSSQACAGNTVWQNCVSGVNQVKAGECYDMDGVGNALSSYWSGGPCPT